ncbi:30S ribosome-binding factor RbfA [Nonomuraea sp. NPDC050556]|uniref:30S ribosome-binding factor RbfA n=1 Tax=Nonomuraea sp. NPDC050556 TaxID=3364369 RepID=UPI00379574E2
MVDAARARKLADRIQQIVAEMLDRRIKDPRLGFVTVTDTRITNDLRDATVFYTVFGSEAERGDTAAALESAKGIIRSEVGKQTGVRHTPSLTFQHDPLPDSARQLDDLLAVAKAKDAEVARKAAGAQYAGDADPYKKPEAEEDEDEPAT